MPKISTKARKTDLNLADLFAGGGGTSTGVARAARRLNRNTDLVAVNHWDVAIETHRRNHPWARHLCTGLDAVRPADEVHGGRLNLLSASPECVFFSNARGGRPVNDQRRSQAWLVMKWLEDLYVESFLLENVQEMVDWAPIGADGRPLKSMRGSIFQDYIRAFKSHGYNVEYRVLNAANYGAATTRQRLYIMGRRGKNKRIVWPDATHACDADLQYDLFSNKAKWRSAAEIIDWSRPSQSIFNRKRPLARTTMERIAAGLRKFGGQNAEPYLVVLRNHMDGRSIYEPIPTVTGGGKHIGLAQPFLITAGGTTGQVRNPKDINSPMPTVLTNDRHGIVQPFLITAAHGDKGGDLGHRAHSLDSPVPTLTGKRQHALIEPFYFNMQRVKDPIYPVDRPMPTITGTSSDYGLCEAFIASYYNGSTCVSGIDEPLPTCTAKARFGLVELRPGIYLDIHFRMLHWTELAAAMGFPKGYDFAGTAEEKILQIGNAVEVNQAEALSYSALAA